MLRFLKKIMDEAPQFNEYVKRSMAYGELREGAVSYVDGIFSSMFIGVKDVTYNGIQEMTVSDEVDSNVSHSVKIKRDYDVSVTFRRKYKLLFKFKGEEIHGVYLYILYCIDKGIVISSDAKYQIIPVVTDSVISVTAKYIFIRPRKDKLFILTDTHHYFKNDILAHGNVDHSERLYKNKKEPGTVGNVLSPIGTYIFVHYGFKSLFYGKDIKLFTDIHEADKLGKTHDVYTSTGKAPAGRFTSGYSSSKLIVCIEKGPMDQLERNMLTTMFYVTDIFPSSVRDIVNILNSDDEENEIVYWRHIIARLVFRDTVDIANASAAIDVHIKGLDNYLDTVIIKKLNEVGYYVEDFFDLLKMISRDGVNMKLKHQKTDDNTSGKYLDILYYLFFPLIVNTNHLISQLAGLVRKGNLTYDSCSSTIKDNIGPRCLFNNFRTTAMSLAIMPVSSSIDWSGGDLTNGLELQERGKGVIRDTSNTKFPAGKRHIIAGDMFLGNILHLPKDWPTPIAKLNPYAKIDPDTKRIAPTDKEKQMLSIINKLLTGKVSVAQSDKLSELMDGDIEPYKE